MEAKEIYKGISKTPWQCPDAEVRDAGYNIIATFDAATATEDDHNELAACLAVNSTFGKGYDPSKMDEMYRVLISLSESQTFRGEYPATCSIINDLLSAAKL